MRLYSRTGATRLDDPEYGTFIADEQGGFDLPDEVSERLHSFHLNGQRLWENDIERQQRLINEELERRKDPTTLLSAVEQLVKAAQATAVITASQQAAPATPTAPAEPEQAEPAPEPAKKPATRRTATKKADK